ncbi:hypothetical protein PYCC9005_004883 [Savitreella phatthalungensis]
MGSSLGAAIQSAIDFFGSLAKLCKSNKRDKAIAIAMLQCQASCSSRLDKAASGLEHAEFEQDILPLTKSQELLKHIIIVRKCAAARDKLNEHEHMLLCLLSIVLRTTLPKQEKLAWCKEISTTCSLSNQSLPFAHITNLVRLIIRLMPQPKSNEVVPSECLDLLVVLLFNSGAVAACLDTEPECLPLQMLSERMFLATSYGEFINIAAFLGQLYSTDHRILETHVFSQTLRKTCLPAFQKLECCETRSEQLDALHLIDHQRHDDPARESFQRFTPSAARYRKKKSKLVDADWSMVVISRTHFTFGSDTREESWPRFEDIPLDQIPDIVRRGPRSLIVKVEPEFSSLLDYLELEFATPEARSSLANLITLHNANVRVSVTEHDVHVTGASTEEDLDRRNLHVRDMAASVSSKSNTSTSAVESSSPLSEVPEEGVVQPPSINSLTKKRAASEVSQDEADEDLPSDPTTAATRKKPITYKAARFKQRTPAKHDVDEANSYDRPPSGGDDDPIAIIHKPKKRRSMVPKKTPKRPPLQDPQISESDVPEGPSGPQSPPRRSQIAISRGDLTKTSADKAPIFKLPKEPERAPPVQAKQPAAIINVKESAKPVGVDWDMIGKPKPVPALNGTGYDKTTDANLQSDTRHDDQEDQDFQQFMNPQPEDEAAEPHADATLASISHEAPTHTNGGTGDVNGYQPQAQVKDSLNKEQLTTSEQRVEQQPAEPIGPHNNQAVSAVPETVISSAPNAEQYVAPPSEQADPSSESMEPVARAASRKGTGHIESLSTQAEGAPQELGKNNQPPRIELESSTSSNDDNTQVATQPIKIGKTKSPVNPENQKAKTSKPETGLYERQGLADRSAAINALVKKKSPKNSSGKSLLSKATVDARSAHFHTPVVKEEILKDPFKDDSVYRRRPTTAVQQKLFDAKWENFQGDIDDLRERTNGLVRGSLKRIRPITMTFDDDEATHNEPQRKLGRLSDVSSSTTVSSPLGKETHSLKDGRATRHLPDLKSSADTGLAKKQAAKTQVPAVNSFGDTSLGFNDVLRELREYHAAHQAQSRKLDHPEASALHQERMQRFQGLLLYALALTRQLDKMDLVEQAWAKELRASINAKYVVNIRRQIRQATDRDRLHIHKSFSNLITAWRMKSKVRFERTFQKLKDS